MNSAMVFLKINVSFSKRKLVKYFSTPFESRPYYFKERNLCASLISWAETADRYLFINHHFYLLLMNKFHQFHVKLKQSYVLFGVENKTLVLLITAFSLPDNFQEW